MLAPCPISMRLMTASYSLFCNGSTLEKSACSPGLYTGQSLNILSLDMGSITNLNETDIFPRNQLQSSSSPRTPSPILDRSMRRATRSQSRFASIPKSPSPSLSKQAITPPLDALKFKSPIEQELNSDVQLGLGRDIGSSSWPLSDDEVCHSLFSFLSDIKVLFEQKQEGDSPVKTEIPLPVHPSTPPLVLPEVIEEAESAIIEADQEGDITEADEDTTMEMSTSIQPPLVESIHPEIPEKSLAEDSDADMENVEDAIEVGSEEEVSRTVDRPSVPPLSSISSPPSKEPIKSSIPFIHLGPSSPLPTTPAPRPPVIVLAQEHPTADSMTFTFEGNLSFNPDQPKVLPSTLTRQHHYNPDYTLPSLKVLPPEFNRKFKTKSRRREKDKERDKENRDYVKKDDWFPMGINKWAATLNANPVWKRVARPTKCLSSREWGVCISLVLLSLSLKRWPGCNN
jgi:chromatin modification-related protein VID21